MRQVNRYQIDRWYHTILIKSFDKSKQTINYHLQSVYVMASFAVERKTNIFQGQSSMLM